MGRSAPLASATLIYLVGAGCASTGALENELSMVRRELAEMRKDLADTQLQMQRLEGQVTLISVGRAITPTTEVADGRQPARVEARSPRAESKKAPQPSHVLPVVRLSNKVEPKPVDDTWAEPGAVDDGSPPIVIKMGPSSGGDLEEDRLPVDHEVLKKPDPLEKKAKVEPVAASEATSAEMEQEYAAALGKLRAEKKPDEALALFEAFRVKYPRSNLADNATYWAGECQVARGAHADAIRVFEKLLADFPRSTKRPDALDRVSESWLVLGDRPKAEKVARELVSKYPSSEAAGRARARLRELGQ